MGLNTITKKREIEYEGYSLDKEYIYLTTTNKMADDINQDELSKINESIFYNKADISGKFDKK